MSMLILLSILAAPVAQQESIDVARLVLAVLCVVVASSMALGASIGLARRMHQLADRPSSQKPPEQSSESDDEAQDEP